MSPDSYKKTRKIRIVLLLLVLLLLAGTGYKLFRNSVKIAYVMKASKYYAALHPVLAQDFYEKAETIGYFDYYDDLTMQRLDELRHVGDLKRIVGELDGKMAEAGRLKDVNGFADAYGSFKAMEKNAAGSPDEFKIYGELDEFYNIGPDAASFFADIRKTAEKRRDSNINRGSFADESFIQDVSAIPQEFFGSEESKKEYVFSFVNGYESAKFDALVKTGDFSAVLSEAGAAAEKGREMQMEYVWLAPALEEYVKTVLDNDAGGKDSGKYYSHAKEYVSFLKEHMPDMDSDVSVMLKEKSEADIAGAGKLAEDGNYSEALHIYRAVGNYTDMTDIINSTERKWIGTDPLVIFSGKYPGLKFENAVSGKNEWKAEIYAIASVQSAGAAKIYLGLLNNGKNAVDVEAYECEAFKDGSAAIRKLSVDKKLDSGEPVIIAEASSGKRKGAYAGYELKDGSLREIFRLEADSISVEKAGTIVADNPAGEGSGKICYFELKGGAYVFAGVKPPWTEIRAVDMAKYPDRLIRFDCNVIAKCNEGMIATDIKKTDFFILITGTNLPGMGKQTITGRYAGRVKVQKGLNTVDIPELALGGR